MESLGFSPATVSPMLVSEKYTHTAPLEDVEHYDHRTHENVKVAENPASCHSLNPNSNTQSELADDRMQHEELSQEACKFIKGKGLMFDTNEAHPIDPANSLGRRLFGDSGMRFMKKYYYRGLAHVLFPLYLAAFPVTFLHIFSGTFENMLYLANGFTYLAVIYQIGITLVMNQSLIRLSLQSFENVYLLVLTFFEAFSITDLVGWNTFTVGLFFFLLLSQANAILVESLHYGFPGFVAKWSVMVKYRAQLDIRCGSLSPITVILVKALKTIQTQDDSENQVDTQHLLHHYANQQRSHMISNTFSLLLKPDPRWSKVDRISWRLRIIWSFVRKDIAIAYFTGIVYSSALYTMYVFNFSNPVHDRSVQLLWMKWTASEIYRTTTFTGIIFYTKRLVMMVLYPFHLCSVPRYQIAVPLVSNWSDLMNDKQKSIYVRELNQLAISSTINSLKDVQKDPKVWGDMNADLMDNLSLPVKNAKSIRGPLFVISSSGGGRIFDCRQTFYKRVFRNLAQPWKNGHAFRYALPAILLWVFAFFIFAAYFISTNKNVALAATIVCLPAVVLIPLQILDLTGDLVTRCALSFESLYMISNIACFSFASFGYLPGETWHKAINYTAITLITFLVVVLDSVMISFREFSIFISGITLQEKSKIGPQHLPKLRLIADSVSNFPAALNIRTRMQRIDQFADEIGLIESSSHQIHSSSSDKWAFPVDRIKSSPRMFPRSALSIMGNHFSASSLLWRSTARRMFGDTKKYFLGAGLSAATLLSFVVSLSLVKERNVFDISFLGASWENQSIVKTCLLNFILFVGKRVFSSIFHPHQCTSIALPLIRVPLYPCVIQSVDCRNEMSSAVSIGFYRAPVTKVVAGSLCFLQFLSSLSRAPKSGGAHGFLVHLVFSDGLAALFGLSLVYKFREFERRFGSRKFAAFVMFVAALSFGLHLAIRNQNLDVFSHFPSILIFALFVQYFAEVPATSQSRLFGLPVTSKTFVYVQGYLYYRAMFFQDYTNLIAGLLCGFLYRMRSLPFRNMAVMKPIADFCSSNILPLVQTAPPRRRRNVVAPGQEFFPEFADTDAPSRTQAQANQTATRRHVQHQQDVDPAALSELVQMGFDSAQATQALRLTQNNIELATSLLLDS